MLVGRVHRPYSWLVPYTNFPSTVEIWDRKGAVVKQIADLPVADTVPNGGVLPGPRSYQWQPLAPATVAWAEALDNGDPQDQGSAPRQGDDARRAVHGGARRARADRVSLRGVAWTDSGRGTASPRTNGARRWTRTWIIDKPGAAPRKLWDRSQEDSYGNPGTPLRRDRAPRARRRFVRAATASSWPAPAPRPKARGRSSIA